MQASQGVEKERCKQRGSRMKKMLIDRRGKARPWCKVRVPQGRGRVMSSTDSPPTTEKVPDNVLSSRSNGPCGDLDRQITAVP